MIDIQPSNRLDEAEESHVYYFPSAFVDGEWKDRVVITICRGEIREVATSVDPAEKGRNAALKRVEGLAIPGIGNVHSHAFQRAFAGLSEYRTSDHDSFWTWRTLMYEYAIRWNPEDIYTIAHGLYRELLRNGYTWVGEFHYLHNDPDGSPYGDTNCMADALVRAAQDCGIGICIMPVLYQRAGFHSGNLIPVQRRFVTDEDNFVERLARLRRRWSNAVDVQIGMAFHSLRAVGMDVINRVVAAVRADYPETPIHIHVAEQIQEVTDCQEVTGQRPVEYLLSNADVDHHWCLIHATHITPKEIEAIANARATVGVCPTTEANLGDGIFPAVEYLLGGGDLAIGSDSHVSVSPRSELRLLEYGQRLVRRQRAVLGTELHSVGRRLVTVAAEGGAKALGIHAGRLSVGQRADIVILDPTHRSIDFAVGDRILDRYLFCDAGNPVSGVMVGGRCVDCGEGSSL